jgi:folate-binding protein YgfZ
LADDLAAARDASVLVHLADQGLIRASGSDAVPFLHNLITNDVQNLAADGVRFAGFCTPKGRLLATFYVWHQGEELLIQLSADIQPAMLKKLSTYILRSKVTLADAGADTVLLGLGGPGAAAQVAALVGGSVEVRQVAAIHGGQLLRLDAQRFVLALRAETAMELWPRLAGKSRPAGLAAWRWLEIAAGQPRVVGATQEVFVPQMLNMEAPAVGGVVFTKGCYPGQEIVARTQYLGRIKRRMFRAAIDAAAPVGTDVFTPEAGDQHCGTLVTVAPSPGGGYECLVVVQSSGAELGEIHVGSLSGPKLRLLSLPYAVA